MTPEAPASAESNRWAVLALLGVAQLMVVLDGTIVNIALARHAIANCHYVDYAEVVVIVGTRGSARSD
ncbi:MAG: hypothetical protein ACR2L9_05510 [Solirubrobacteraceae bacterium]